MSTALQDLGYDVSGALWTAGVLLEHPDGVAAAHRAYFRAGARVATTASYQASVPGLVAAGLTASQARALLARSVVLAREVRDELADDGARRWVAASVGPYGAVLADGSEYRGRYGLTRARLRDFHEARLEVLAAAGPDLLAVETIPDLDEAAVLAGLVDQVGLPTWFSFSTADGRLRSGQPLAEGFQVAGGARCVRAVGVNCCRPDEVADAVRLAVQVTGLPAVAYPNAGEEWDPVARRWRGTPRLAPWLAPTWVAAGAGYVGGCCRVGPEAIGRLAAALPGPGAGWEGGAARTGP
jgi:homocysteine S-methyltransferase